MKNKKILCGMGTLAVCSMFVGCGSNVVTTESENVAIDEAETVESVNDTETVCEHEWVDASCAEPKHCSVCGEIEGETLEHTLTEANYQQPATCEVCGETEGEPLQADFEKYGLVCNTKVDTPITFKVPNYDTYELTETAEVTFSDYEIFQSDDRHKAVEGYEWRAVTATSISHNGVVAQNLSDYYNVAAFDSYDESKDTYTVNYNGIDYTECQYDDDTIQNEWNDKVLTVKRRYFFRVPIGYDGHILYYYTYTNEGNGGYINDVADENIVIFRLE